MEVVRAMRSEGWSDVYDNGDDLSDDEGDDSKYANMHENLDCKWSALHALFCEGREEGPIDRLSSLYLQRHSN